MWKFLVITCSTVKLRKWFSLTIFHLFFPSEVYFLTQRLKIIILNMIPVSTLLCVSVCVCACVCFNIFSFCLEALGIKLPYILIIWLSVQMGWLHLLGIFICSFGMQSYLVFNLWMFLLLSTHFHTSSNFLVFKHHHQIGTSLLFLSLSVIKKKRETFKYTSIEATCVPYIDLNVNHEERASSILGVKSWTWYAIVVSLWSKETHNWISRDNFFFAFFPFSCPW